MFVTGNVWIDAIPLYCMGAWGVAEFGLWAIERLGRIKCALSRRTKASETAEKLLSS